MKSQIGDSGTEQFTVTTTVDGKLIRVQPIHDPFLCNKTVTVIGRWDAFCGIFRRRQVVTELRVDGTDGAIRAIMGLDPESLRLETEAIQRARAISRENAGAVGYCSQSNAH